MPKTKSNSAARAATIRFVEPMYAQLVQQLPNSNDWLYEVKFDGYRCLAGKDTAEVTLWSRRGNDFTEQFPNIARACEQLPPRTLLDGEIVAIDENGRISFNLTATPSVASTSIAVLCVRSADPSRDQSSQ